MRTLPVMLVGMLLVNGGGEITAVRADELEEEVAHAESPWSQAIDGLQARVVLKWTEVFDGTPIISPFWSCGTY